MGTLLGMTMAAHSEEGIEQPTQAPTAENQAEESASIEELKKGAQSGDAKAQYELGMRYMKGDGVNESLLDASIMFQNAAKQDYPNAAEMHKTCQDTLQEIAEAAYEGNPECQYKLGCYSVDTEDIWTRTLVDGICWLNDAYKAGISEAKQKIEQKIAELREKAGKGDARAQLAMGELYYGGYGVDQDYAQAAEWYRVAANQGQVQAQCNLGECYLQGLGVEVDEAQAVKYFRMSADAGCVMAMNNLAVCYATGQGVEKNPEEAVKLYRKGAELGEPLAQKNLGTCYLQGDGVPQDHAEAVKWLTLAAEQEHPSALYHLGNCYHQGTGVPKDDQKAIRLWIDAAKRGYRPAIERLRKLYADGEGASE